MHVADRLTDGIASFNDVQILNLARTRVEIFVENFEYWYIHYGKNTDRIIVAHPPKAGWRVPVTHNKPGTYFYWYTVPLVNYYHTLLDGVGALTHYIRLREVYPDIVLLVNCTPRPKGGVVRHPPFVTELLDLLDIRWEYTDETAVYERVLYGAPLGILNGKRCRPPVEQYELLRTLIGVAHDRAPSAPGRQVYISRRAHANPVGNRKSVIGEDNTVRRGLVNEDSVVEILQDIGYTEVFGENLTLAEKIVLFHNMDRYISTAGAGVANLLWTMPRSVSVGGIHTPGFPFPGNDHSTHICTGPEVNCTITNYPGRVSFVDPVAGARNYNSPWRIDNLVAFRNWARTV
jgi:hypothetical protein